MKGYHFLKIDRRLQFPPYTLVEEGETYTCEGKLTLCHNGLHASKRIIDALRYAPGPIVCGVELGGEIIHATDKSVARTRKVLWMFDATNILHEFACRCSEDALALLGDPYPKSIAAIKAKRDWLAGKITEEELDTIRQAAWNAAANTAWNVTGNPAWHVARLASGYIVASVDSSAATAKSNRRLTQMVARARKG